MTWTTAQIEAATDSIAAVAVIADAPRAFPWNGYRNTDGSRVGLEFHAGGPTRDAGLRVLSIGAAMDEGRFARER